MEADEVAGVVGKRLHVAQSTQQRQAVNGQHIGVVLRNHRVVVGITALNETAGDASLVKADFSIALIKADDDVTTFLLEHVAQQRCRLLRKDKRCRLFALDVEHFVAYKLVTVTSNDGEALRRQVEIDTIHDGAQLILSRCKQGTSQIVGQCIAGQRNHGSILADLLSLGKLVGTFDRHREHTVLIADLGNVSFLIDVEGDRLLGETLNAFQKILVTDGETTIGVAFGQFQLG